MDQNLPHEWKSIEQLNSASNGARWLEYSRNQDAWKQLPSVENVVSVILTDALGFVSHQHQQKYQMKEMNIKK